MTGIPVIGAASMALDASNIIIGSEGGRVMRCSHPGPVKCNTSHLHRGPVRWENSAVDFVENLPASSQQKLIKHVETWASDARKQVVTAPDIFASKPRIQDVLPSPAGSVTEYEAHVYFLRL